jgi:hypothetical protein
MNEVDPPFVTDSPDYQKLMGEITDLRNRLLRLKHHSAIIETDEKQGESVSAITAENKLSTINISGNKAAFEVECQSLPCVLIFNMAALPAWRAFSESNPLPIKRANFAFLSSEVTKGKHFVWFEYQNLPAVIGMVITLLSYIGGLLKYNSIKPHNGKSSASTQPTRV